MVSPYLFLYLSFSFCLSIYLFISLSCSHVWLYSLSLISWIVFHIFEYWDDKVVFIFSSYTFPLNIFVLQHFQQEVSLFDMFSCFKLCSAIIKIIFQLISDIFSYAFHISAIFSCFQTFSAILFTFQLFSSVFSYFQLFSDIFSDFQQFFYLYFSFKLSDVSIPMHFQQ